MFARSNVWAQLPSTFKYHGGIVFIMKAEFIRMEKKASAWQAMQSDETLVALWQWLILWSLLFVRTSFLPVTERAIHHLSAILHP